MCYFRSMPERVFAVIHYEGKKHSFPIRHCCDKLYRTVRKYVNFIVKDEHRELYWKDEWSSYYIGSAKDLSTAVEWMKKHGNVRVSEWEPLHIPIFVGENHMNEEQRKESDTPMNGPVYFEFYFNGDKSRFFSECCCDTLYRAVRKYIDSIVGDTSLELFWKDEWSSYFIGSPRELSIAVEWMRKNKKKDCSKPHRIRLFAGEQNTEGMEGEKLFYVEEFVYFELKFNGKTRLFSEPYCKTLLAAVRKYVDSMVGDKTVEVVWKDEGSSCVIETDEGLSFVIKWTREEKNQSPLEPLFVRLFIHEKKSTEENEGSVDTTVQESDQKAEVEKVAEEGTSSSSSIHESLNDLPLSTTMQLNEPKMSTEDPETVDESMQQEEMSMGESMEGLQSLPTKEEQTVNGRMDLEERENALKIRENELQLKEEIFERKVAEFQLRMEEFEEKLDELELRIDDVEYERDTDHIESRMDEMEDRLTKVEDSME